MAVRGGRRENARHAIEDAQGLGVGGGFCRREGVEVRAPREIKWSDENERGGLYATYNLCITGLDDLSQIPKA